MTESPTESLRCLLYTSEELRAKNLILYHTEDKNLADRRKLYTEEGQQYYHGNLIVPDDLDRILL